MPLSTHLNLQHPKLQKSELVNPQPSTPNLSAACWKNVTSQICKVSCRPARVQFPSNPIATRIMQQAYYGSAPGPAPTATQQGYGYGYGYGAPQGKERCFVSCEVTGLSLSTVRHWGFGRMARACSSLCPQSAESKNRSGWFRCGASIPPHKFAVECFAVVAQSLVGVGGCAQSFQRAIIPEGHCYGKALEEQ